MSLIYRAWLNSQFQLLFLTKKYQWRELPDEYMLPEKYIYILREKDSKCVKLVIEGLGKKYEKLFCIDSYGKDAFVPVELRKFALGVIDDLNYREIDFLI